METERLKYFSVIAETGSLTKASQLLGISHSGLSKAISSLEDEVQLKLFRPLGRGLEITPEGKWFYQKAQEILRITNEIKSGQRQTLKVVRIGLSTVIAATCAGSLSRELNAPMAFSEIDVGEVEGKILSGEIDFGIAFVPVPRPELEYLELGEVVFNPFARADLLLSYTAQEVPFAVPDSIFQQNPLGFRNRDGWPLNVSRHTYYSASSFSIARDLLRSGQAAVYLPDFIVSLENKNFMGEHKIVKMKEIKDVETKRKLYLIKQQSVEESSEMKKVAKVLRRICCHKG